MRILLWCRGYIAFLGQCWRMMHRINYFKECFHHWHSTTISISISITTILELKEESSLSARVASLFDDAVTSWSCVPDPHSFSLVSTSLAFDFCFLLRVNRGIHLGQLDLGALLFQNLGSFVVFWRDKRKNLIGPQNCLLSRYSLNFSKWEGYNGGHRS